MAEQMKDGLIIVAFTLSGFIIGLSVGAAYTPYKKMAIECHERADWCLDKLQDYMKFDP